MKIAILSRNQKLYSTSRLVEAANKRNHDVMVINPLKCYMSINLNQPQIHYENGQNLEGFSAVIPRIGASVTFYGAAVLRQFEMQGTYSINPSVGITRSRDKLRAYQVLSRKGVGMPITGFAHSLQSMKALLTSVGGAPLIIKLLEGTQGKGVILAETLKNAENLIEAFKGLDASFLVQEFIKEAECCDIRCFVIGDKVVAAMERQAETGEFRSNIHQGGVARSVKITPEERRIAVKASKIMGLNVAGVDIVRSDRGPLVLEVNSSPGLKGIESVTGQDIADMIIEFIERNAKKQSAAIG